MNIITVLTDFGLKDPYVGIMKGVMLSINPQAQIVDIMHEVEAQDITEGSFLVAEYYRFFQKGSIHLCIIDPGVGSDRKALVVAADGHFFVGPDNGLFSLVLQKDARIHEISNRQFMLERVSGTFHGRDVFAPAAAHLSSGTGPAELGPPVAEAVCLPDLFPSVSGDVMTGRIVRFDRFGNAITNIPHDRFEAFTRDRSCAIEVADLSFQRLNRSYYEKEYTCLIGSAGYLEFALFAKSLSAGKHLRKGDAVTVRRAAR